MYELLFDQRGKMALRLSVLNDHLNITRTNSQACTVLVLNRPKVLNVLTENESTELTKEIISAAGPIVIAGQGKAFCAGGDLKYAIERKQRRAYLSALEDVVMMHLEAAKRSYAVMTGHTMGYGAGIALATKVRVATDTTHLAFPENAIGLVPDVGATYWFSRLQPRELGLFLLLTGTPMNGADCFYAGIAKYYVPVSRLKNLEELRTRDPEQFFAACHQPPSRGQCYIEKCSVMKHLDRIRTHFLHHSVAEIMNSLRGDDSQWAKATLDTLSAACPLSLLVCWELAVAGKHRAYRQCLSHELNAMAQLTQIRCWNFEAGTAALFSKQKPQWQPASLEDVSQGLIRAVLDNPDGAQLRFS